MAFRRTPRPYDRNLLGVAPALDQGLPTVRIPPGEKNVFP